MAYPRVAAIIPARFASTRFPGKPLALIDGLPMVWHVARRAMRVRSIDRVVVATDDTRIFEAVTQLGIDVILIPEPCRSGTDRVFSAVSRLGWEKSALILNIQGDEPLIDPDSLEDLVDVMLLTGAGMGTSVRRSPTREWLCSRSVKVEVSNGWALDFARNPTAAMVAKPSRIHVGVYAFTPAVLAQFCQLPMSAREEQYQLEQLRALDNGISILAVPYLSDVYPVDTPEDLEHVRAFIQHERLRQ